MAKNALVIKGANFAANKLTTVTFVEDEKPCTAIALSESSKAVTALGDFTLTATVTPADTTDDVLWSSSDETVATVADGVVTVVGLGSATITATCGEQTATCVVSCDNVVLAYYPMFAQLHSSWEGANATSFPIETYKYGWMVLGDNQNLETTRKLKNQSSNTALNSCPIKFPANTAAIELSYGSGMYPGTIYFGWMDTTQAAGDTSALLDCALRISMDTTNSTKALTTETLDYSVAEGANSFAIAIRCKGSEFADTDTPAAIAEARQLVVKAVASVS